MTRFFRLKRAWGRVMAAEGGIAESLRFPLLWLPLMPGIDFAEVRSRIRIAQVLELAGFAEAARRGTRNCRQDHHHFHAARLRRKSQ